MPRCGGINHAGFSIDGGFALFTREFDSAYAKIDVQERKIVAYLKLKMPATRFYENAVKVDGIPSEIFSSKKGVPQDIRISPNGKHSFVADMEADDVHVVDGEAFTEVGFTPTGPGTHGLYPSRDGKRLYVADRSSHKIHGPAHIFQVDVPYDLRQLPFGGRRRRNSP